MRGSAYAQIMRMCADNAPSACIMRECVLCADYAQMHMVRMCACAVLRSMRICAACVSAHVRCCAVCAEAAPIAGRPQVLHIPSYSRGGGRIHQKALHLEHRRRKSLLNESRKVSPCHTFQTGASEIFTPTCSLSAAHAKRCNSCRSGAWPTMPKPNPCRARRRRKPHQAPAIITIGTEIGLVRLERHHASIRTQERPRRRKANDEIAPNAPTPPDPPKRCGFLEKTVPGKGESIKKQ